MSRTVAIAWMVRDGAGDYYPAEDGDRMTKHRSKGRRFASRVEAERVADGITRGRVVRIVPRSRRDTPVGSLQLGSKTMTQAAPSSFFVIREMLYFNVTAAKDREDALGRVREINEKILELGYVGLVSVSVQTPDFAEVRNEPGDGEDFEEEALSP